MSIKNINWRTCLMVIAVIVLVLVMVWFLFGDKLFTSKDNFVQELIDMGLMDLDEETADSYAKYVKTGTEIFEDENVKVKLEQYILFDDLALAKFSVEKISDEDLVVDGSSWNLKKDISYENGNVMSKDGYFISLSNGNDEYFDTFSVENISKETAGVIYIYMKSYFFEKAQDYKYVVSSKEKNVEFPLELIKTDKVIVHSDNCNLFITPHMIYTYEKPDFNIVKLEYSDGKTYTVINDKKEYAAYSSEKEMLWYYISDTMYKTDKLQRIYLDENSYAYDKDSKTYVKE